MAVRRRQHLKYSCNHQANKWKKYSGNTFNLLNPVLSLCLSLPFLFSPFSHVVSPSSSPSLVWVGPGVWYLPSGPGPLWPLGVSSLWWAARAQTPTTPPSSHYSLNTVRHNWCQPQGILHNPAFIVVSAAPMEQPNTFFGGEMFDFCCMYLFIVRL